MAHIDTHETAAGSVTIFNKVYFNILSSVCVQFGMGVFVLAPLGLISFGVVEQVGAPVLLLVLCVVGCAVAQMINDRIEVLVILLLAYGALIVQFQQVAAEAD